MRLGEIEGRHMYSDIHGMYFIFGLAMLSILFTPIKSGFWKHLKKLATCLYVRFRDN